ncbi:MAG: hypothetical protein ACK5CW_18740 [Verrucomicrobiota bacterium]
MLAIFQTLRTATARMAATRQNPASPGIIIRSALSCRAALLGLLLVAAGMQSHAAAPPAADLLSEGSASQWFAGAQSATASITDVTDRVQVGSKALRFSTTGAFDTWAGTPVGKAAAWNLQAAGIRGLAFWMYSESDSTYGFQNNSPWIRLHTGSQSYLELHPRRELMNDCRGKWVRFVVPFSGNSDWEALPTGNPSLANINWIEFHADTWDAGLRFWLDGIDFVSLEVTSLTLNKDALRLWSGYRWQNLKLKAQTASGELPILGDKLA